MEQWHIEKPKSQQEHLILLDKILGDNGHPPIINSINSSPEDVSHSHADTLLPGAHPMMLHQSQHIVTNILESQYKENILASQDNKAQPPSPVLQALWGSIREDAGIPPAPSKQSAPAISGKIIFTRL